MHIEPAPESLVGQVLASRYRIEARLGQGAMGTVYRVRHLKVGRAFAVKMLHPHFLSDAKTRTRFAREAQLAGVLRHPNVVSVVDFGETSDGQAYLVMEYAEGATLCQLVADAAPMPAARVISLARQLCDGLQHAHEHGLIHRDLKTENVLIGCDHDGHETPKIVDFGIAILRDDAASSNAARLTSAGLVLGTPHYMAPEHATGSPIDHRIDLFALGVMCFEMLTGVVPFDGDGVDVARANLLLETPAMRVRVPGLCVDPLLEAFTRKLMMKSRDDRPASARAARELLDLIERDRAAAAIALRIGPDGRQPAARPTPATVIGGPQTTRGAPPVVAAPETMPARHVLRALQRKPTPVMPMQPRAEGTELSLPVLPIGSAMPGQLVAVPPPDEPRACEPALHGHWQGDDEHAAPRRSRRGEFALVGLAALVAVVALVIAVGMRRAASRVAAIPSPAAAPAHREVAQAPPLPATVTAPTPEPAPQPAPAPPPIAIAPRTAARTRPADDRAARPLAPMPAPSAAPTTQPAASPPAPVPVAPESPVARPAASPPAPVAVAPESPVARPAVPVPQAAARAQASAASVAQLYATVGKELKALDRARGSAATADLWPLYLRVRINDVIADPVKCDEADTLLRYLETQIADRTL